MKQAIGSLGCQPIKTANAARSKDAPSSIDNGKTAAGIWLTALCLCSANRSPTFTFPDSFLALTIARSKSYITTERPCENH
ncbi:hypothetical protein [Chamaesiphon sp. GL140_3_metabinner_50]|uniref:hypothetical protein n=1 Tax=Chamaesiphon sp. GL140_3_metabinner_50 TaxID=2970812 RepID=UPI0025D117CB|nr:hypothetical protein [Chamaesiphon sp. GL140_3_metabinner_50]